MNFDINHQQSSSIAGNKKMRIAFFIPFITQGRGGTENVGHMMANAMAHKGHHVVIFTFDDDPAASSLWPLHESIKLHCLANSDSREHTQQLTLQVAQGNFDLIVGLFLNRICGRYVRCAHLLGLPLVLSEHIDPAMPQFLNSFTQEERLVFLYEATRIHLLATIFKDTLPDFLQNRVRVIPNTVAHAQRQALTSSPDGINTLLTTARLVTRKNIAWLLCVFSKITHLVPDWRLQIVGDGPEMSNLTQLAAEKGITHRVDFVGHSENPYQYYENAQLFVIPSLYEGFPMVTLEAMSHGLPLSGYAACNGVNEQIRHGINGLLSTGDNSGGSLGDDLLTLMTDADLRKRMGEASKDIFDNSYSNNIVFDAWEHLFCESVQSYKKPCRPAQQQYVSCKLDEYIYGEYNLIKKNVS